MNKERELLQRLVDSGVLGGYSFIAEVKEILTQPEQEPSASRRVMYQRGYADGFRRALEKSQGIGEEE